MFTRKVWPETNYRQVRLVQTIKKLRSDSDHYLGFGKVNVIMPFCSLEALGSGVKTVFRTASSACMRTRISCTVVPLLAQDAYTTLPCWFTIIETAIRPSAAGLNVGCSRYTVSRPSS